MGHFHYKGVYPLSFSRGIPPSIGGIPSRPGGIPSSIGGIPPIMGVYPLWVLVNLRGIPLRGLFFEGVYPRTGWGIPPQRGKPLGIYPNHWGYTPKGFTKSKGFYPQCSGVYPQCSGVYPQCSGVYPQCSGVYPQCSG